MWQMCKRMSQKGFKKINKRKKIEILKKYDNIKIVYIIRGMTMKGYRFFLKRISALLLAFAIVFSLTGNKLLALAADEQSKNATKIQIVHTNDIHGYYTQTNRGQIGFAYLKALANNQGADLIVDVGDTYHGQAFATVEKGEGIAQLMGEVGYDCMTVGNHDWSYGSARLKELENIQGFPILAGNITGDNGDLYFDTPYIVKNVVADDGTQLRVGILGVIDDTFYHSTASENVKGIYFSEESASAAKTAKILREKENCQIVIALTHNENCEEFIKNTKGIDAVIAGHEHLVMDKSCKDADGRDVRLVEAGSHFSNVGVLTLTYDTDKKAVTDFAEKTYTNNDLGSLTPDSNIAVKISEIEKKTNRCSFHSRRKQ